MRGQRSDSQGQRSDSQGWSERSEVRGQTHRVGVQHGEEVWAAEELGAGGLEQQGQTGAAGGVAHHALPAVLYAHTHNTIIP